MSNVINLFTREVIDVVESPIINNHEAPVAVSEILNKTDKAWLTFIEDCSNGFKVWDDAKQRSFRMRLNGSSKILQRVKQALMDALISKMPINGYSIDQKLDKKGFEYLWRMNFKKNGSPRKNAWGYFEQRVLKQFSHFTFVGLHNLSSNSYTQYVPVYRCYATDGSWFEYTGVTFKMSEVLNVCNRADDVS